MLGSIEDTETSTFEKGSPKRISAPILQTPLEDPESGAVVVLDVLRLKISKDEFHQIADAMRKSMWDPWL